MEDEMNKAEKALDLVEKLARLTTPEEEFESQMNEDGVIEEDGVTYDDVDEMIADMDDERLMEEYGAFMDFVRAAKEIVKEGEADDQQG
ncbi:hypothetical protein EHM76_04295 [bacterium]|nr:MAG: hypothetical protein EHM76_04295 [bacterium]